MPRPPSGSVENGAGDEEERRGAVRKETDGTLVPAPVVGNRVRDRGGEP